VINQIRAAEIDSIEGIAWKTTNGLGLISCLISLIIQFWKIDEIIDLLKMIKRVDEKLILMNSSIDLKKQRRELFWWLLISNFILQFLNIAPQLLIKLIREFEVGSFMTITFTLTFVYMENMIFQFAIAAMAIHMRFARLNSKLEVKMKNLDIFTSELLTDAYEMLFKCMLMINSSLTLQLVPMFTFSLVTITFSIFSVLQLYFTVKMNLFYTMFLLANILWTSIQLFLVFIAIFSAEILMKNVKKFFELKFEMEKCRFDDKLKQKFTTLIKFVKETDYQPQTIFFKIDWKLLMMVSGVFNFFRTFQVHFYFHKALSNFRKKYFNGKCAFHFETFVYLELFFLKFNGQKF
jgi:hypothetical protein